MEILKLLQYGRFPDGMSTFTGSGSHSAAPMGMSCATDVIPRQRRKASLPHGYPSLQPLRGSVGMKPLQP